MSQTSGKAAASTRRLVRGLVRRLRTLPHRLRGGAEIVSCAHGRPPAIALTFDDGPSEWTLDIAKALEAHGCHGTFFLLGANVVKRPEIVGELAAAGHELGNHLWSHSNPEHQTSAAIRAEIDRTADAINAAGGGLPRLVRPPYCSAPHAVARAAGRATTKPLIVLRSVDPADWRAENPAEIVEHVLAKIQPGDIVCMHDGVSPNNRGTPSRAATAAAVAQLVPALLDRGLSPVTVTELLA